MNDDKQKLRIEAELAGERSEVGSVSIRVDLDTYELLKADAQEQHRTMSGQLRVYQEAYHGKRTAGS